MAGRGVDDDNSELADLASGLGIRDRVHLVGPWPEVEKIYPGFDIFCLSSQSMEGFPNVLGEAMSCGVPCVSTEVGDAAKIVADTGLIVPARDLDELTGALRAMIGLVKEDPLGMAERCRERIEREFSLAKIVQEYERLYAKAGEHARASRDN